jgi:hypothetical protein
VRLILGGALLLATTGAAVEPVKPAAWLAFERVWAGVAAYSTTITFFEQKDTKVQTTVLDYTFRKPSSATVHIVKGANAGVTIVWGGGSTVVAHRGSGLAALFKKSYSLHDKLMTTIRGSSIDQLSFAAILAHAQDSPGTISQATGPEINGIPTEAVTLIPRSSVADTGLTREIVIISALTNIPLRVLGYTGTTLVRQLDFANMKLELIP